MIPQLLARMKQEHATVQQMICWSTLLGDLWGNTVWTGNGGVSAVSFPPVFRRPGILVKVAYTCMVGADPVRSR